MKTQNTMLDAVTQFTLKKKAIFVIYNDIFVSQTLNDSQNSYLGFN